MRTTGFLIFSRYLAVLAAASVVAGCGGMSKRPGTSSATAATSGRYALPAAGSGRGGYYKDDGPAEVIPEGLERTPDAEPRIEPLLPRANRPYEQFGKTYTPITDDRPFAQRGIGSWYGKKFHGNKTSSGEIYDMFKMTAAHPTLPIPSYARVSNLDNGRQIIVRINDRGPFHSDRIIDLSYTAALKLGYLGKGSGMLEVERLLPDEIDRLARLKKTDDGLRQAALAGTVGESPSPQADAYPTLPLAMLGEKRLPPAVTPQGSYYLQLGAFTQTQNAEAMRAEHAKAWADRLPPAEIVQSGIHYRLFVGPFATREKANDAAEKLQASGGSKPMVVSR